MCNSRRRRPCRSPYFHLSQQGLCQRSDRTTQKYPTNSGPRARSRGTAASRNLRPRLCSRHLLHRGSRAGTGASGREEASTRWEGSGEAGWRLDGAWSPSGPVGVRLAVRRGRRRQGPADCRVLVSTCCCSLQAELPNPARRHGRLLGNLPGSSAYRHSPQPGRGAGRERLQKIEQ